MSATSDTAAYRMRPAWPEFGPPEAAMVFRRAPSVLKTARGVALGDFARAIVPAGIWSKMDLLYLIAVGDAQTARLNLAPPWTGTVMNHVRNNSAQGAIPGTPGTWPIGNPALAAGLSRQLVAVGVEDGIDYYDARIFGTPTASGGTVIYLETSTGIPAAPSQTWSGSAFVSCPAGGLDGVSSLRATVTVRDAAFAGFAAAQTFFAPIAGPLRDQRVLVEGYTLPANTVYVQPTIQFNAVAGVPIDITLRIGLPQLVRMDVAGDPIRTSGAAASAVQTLDRFDLAAVNSPAFLADRGYAGGASAYLASRYNPATDAMRYSQDNAHVSVWDLTEREAGNIIPMGVSTGTAVQLGMLHRYSTDRCAFSVNDQSSTLSNARSDGFFVGSRLSAAARSVYRNGVLLADHAAVSMAVPPLELDLLCFKYNTGANRGYWCTDRIALFSLGAGLTSAEQAAFHAAGKTYLQAVGAVA